MSAPATSSQALDGAIDWFVRLSSGVATDEDFHAWRLWLDADPEHQRAWGLTQRLGDKFSAVSDAAARTTLQRRRAAPRRRALLALALAAAGGTSWGGWQAADRAGWMADYRSGIRPLPNLQLADGTRVALNAGTALDVAFDAASRTLVLYAGEILIETAPDPVGSRPFVVRTAQGRITALGTRFLVSPRGDASRVEVWEGAVALHPRRIPDAMRAPVVQAGQSALMTAVAVLQDRPADEARSAAWLRGMLVADDMPLGEFARALAPYRHGRLDCDEDAADLRISGAFPLDDTDRALAAMARALPVRVDALTRYWVTIRLR